MLITVKGIFTFRLIVPPGGEYSTTNRALHILTCSFYVMPRTHSFSAVPLLRYKYDLHYDKCHQIFFGEQVYLISYAKNKSAA